MTDLPIRVAIISRNHLVRTGLVSVIAQLDTRVVVAEAATADGGLGAHDVAIYDLGAVKDVNAYTDLRRLLESGTQVIGLVYDEMRATPAAIAGQTAHLITLSVTPEQLWQVLHQTTEPRQQHSGDGPELQLPGGLTDREFRVIEMIGAGLSNKAIAKELYVSENTIKTNIRTAYNRIGVTDRSGAMLWALQHGLAGGPDQR